MRGLLPSFALFDHGRNRIAWVVKSTPMSRELEGGLTVVGVMLDYILQVFSEVFSVRRDQPYSPGRLAASALVG
jgi:hypothetical protein